MLLNPQKLEWLGEISSLQYPTNHSIDLPIDEVHEIGDCYFKSKEERVINKTLILPDEFGYYTFVGERAYDLRTCFSVSFPTNIAAFVLGRSTLNRMGGTTAIGLYDPGYRGPLGGIVNFAGPNSRVVKVHREMYLLSMVFTTVLDPSKYGGYWNGQK